VQLLYFCLDGYVLLMFVYLYSETGLLIKNLHGSIRYDDPLKRYEQDLFFGQPARELRELLPSRILGEYLHFCYFAFYAIIGGSVAVIYFLRPREYADRAGSALSLAFFTCFGAYLYYPVEGPYWTFLRPEPQQISFFFGQVVHWVLVASAKGTAMPSSHCAISVVCWVSAMLYHVRLAIFYCFLVPGLIFATVWCGFHYGLDSTTGTLWGVLCTIAGVLIAKHTPYHRPRHDKGYGTFPNLASQAKWLLTWLKSLKT
jgi:membrane-associated phospholipid phosphatase